MKQIQTISKFINYLKGIKDYNKKAYDANRSKVSLLQKARYANYIIGFFNDYDGTDSIIISPNGSYDIKDSRNHELKYGYLRDDIF